MLKSERCRCFPRLPRLLPSSPCSLGKLPSSPVRLLFIPSVVLSTFKKSKFGTQDVPLSHFLSSLFFLFFFLEGSPLCTNTVQTRVPSVPTPFETLCSLNTARLKRMPSAFLLRGRQSARSSCIYAQTRTHTHGSCERHNLMCTRGNSQTHRHAHRRQTPARSD